MKTIRHSATLVIMVSRLLNLAGKFALSLFIAKYLGLAALGIYGLVLGATSLLPALAGLGLASLLARQAVEQPKNQLAQGLMRLWQAQNLAYLGLLLVAGAVGYWQQQLVLVLLTLALAYAEQLNNLIFDVLIARQRPVLANLLLLPRGGLWAAVYMGAALLFPALRSVEIVLLVWLAGVGLASVGWLFLTKSVGEVSVKRRVDVGAGYWSGYGVQVAQARPLYLAQLTGLAAQYADRYLVTAFLGLEATGVYVLFWSIGNALYNVTASGVVQVARPHLIKAFRAGDAALFAHYGKRTVQHALFMGLFMQLPLAAVFPWLMPWLQQPAVAIFVPVLWLIQGGMLLRLAVECAATTLYAQGRDRRLLKLNVALLALTLAADAVLLPLYGLYGAAWALVVGALLCVPLAWRWGRA